MKRLRNEQAWIMTGSLMILALIAIGSILIWAQSVLIPFVLAVLFVSLLSPCVDFQITKLRFPHLLAVTTTIIGFVVIAGLMALLLIGAMDSIGSKMTEYSSSFNLMLDRSLHYVQHWGIIVDRKSLIDDLTKFMTEQASSFLVPAVQLVSRTMLVLIFVSFLLLGRRPLTKRGGIYAELDRQIRQYITVKVALSMTTGTLVWIALFSMGLELAGVFGLLTFLLNFIPVIGSVIATLLPIPMAVAQYQDPWWVLAAVAIPGTIQQIMGNGIEPKLLGKGLSLHPVTVVMALAVWGLLWGGAGMILAVPITAIIRIVLLKFESVRPIGNLLGGELPKFGTTEGDGLIN